MAFLDETGLAEVWALAGEKFGQIETGSYVGTGTYGKDNPNQLTCSEFVPKLVALVQQRRWVGVSNNAPDGYEHRNIIGDHSIDNTSTIILMDAVSDSAYGKQAGFGRQNGSALYHGKKSADGKTIYWYSDDTGAFAASYQFNTSGYEYFYIFMG